MNKYQVGRQEFCGDNEGKAPPRRRGAAGGMSSSKEIKEDNEDIYIETNAEREARKTKEQKEMKAMEQLEEKKKKQDVVDSVLNSSFMQLSFFGSGETTDSSYSNVHATSSNAIETDSEKIARFKKKKHYEDSKYCCRLS